MSTFVSGVGDEVVLFAAFLGLSVAFIGLISLYKRGRERTGQQEEAQPREHEDSARSRDTPRDEQESGSAQLRHRVPAGGGGADDGPGEEMITVKLVSLASTQSVQSSVTASMADLRRLYFSGELAQQRDVKFIFRGQVIEDVSTTLQQLGVTNNSAIHVHISQPRPQAAEQEPANQTDENEILDLSNLFVPLFGVILGIVWVSFFMWPNVFSLLTKLSLFALSLGYVVLTYATSFT